MTEVCEVMYMKITDWYDIGIKLLSFGERKLSFGGQKVTFWDSEIDRKSPLGQFWCPGGSKVGLHQGVSPLFGDFGGHFGSRKSTQSR